MDNLSSLTVRIPIEVLRDCSLPPGARILYGEIDGLTREYGYCWASNSLFAERYNVSEQTISNWISALQKAGYITVELSKRKNNGSNITTMRKIWLNVSFKAKPEGLKENLGGTIKNFDEGLQKNLYLNNISINNKGNNKTKNEKQNPKEEIYRFTENERLRESLLDWLEERKVNSKKTITSRLVKRNLTDLKKLSGGDEELAIQIVEKTIARGWAGFFPLDNKRINSKPEKTYGLNEQELEALAADFRAAGVDFE